MKDKNGIANLSKNLQLKLKAFDTTNKKNFKISEYFSWQEFTELFCNTTLIFPLKYKSIDFELINNGKDCIITIDYHNSKNDLIFSYSSANDLLNNAAIENKKLKEIWNEVIV